ncbi:MAG: hypothetical protein KGZ82_10710 [Bacteroidales bacterium]|nr:hypothetical protein [Bacteroidales bacterium]
MKTEYTTPRRIVRTQLAAFIILLTLRLTGLVKLGWWTITAPFWAPVAFIVVFFALLFIFTPKDI